jgi:hypothetical protein
VVSTAAIAAAEAAVAATSMVARGVDGAPDPDIQTRKKAHAQANTPAATTGGAPAAAAAAGRASGRSKPGKSAARAGNARSLEHTREQRVPFRDSRLTQVLCG